ncbi:hypothetical protein GGR52DRAFT_570321 [Hypoxylon sp. FL1284]|nr:hypothetical protein GGR52DRAFT_570321 [Hypoxylon sp. FL1284]
MAEINRGDLRFWAQGPVDLGDCWPSSYLSSSSEYCSPGLCPSGYSPACKSTRSIGTLAETIQTCCPTARPYTCESPNHPGWGGCYWDLPSTWTMSVYAVSDGQTMQQSAVSGAGGAVNALSVQVRFQSTDFASSTSAEIFSSSTERATASSRAGSAAATGSLNDSDATSTDRGGITMGAKVGIGIGVSLGVIVLLVVGAFVLIKRRKSKSISLGPQELTIPAKSAPEPGTAYSEQQRQPVEMYTLPPEMEGNAAMYRR